MQPQQAQQKELDSCHPQLDQVWSREWKAHVQILRDALQSKFPESRIRQLVGDCMALCRTAYSVPPSTDSLLKSISGENSTLLEAAFMWLGGWRPTSAITLAYSKMGVDVGQINGLVDVITQSCLLSETQLAAMGTLYEQTRMSESEISNGLASLQILVAGSPMSLIKMLVADQNMAEAIGVGDPPSSLRSTSQAQRLMDNKLVSLRTLYMQANGLRLQTLQELHNLLTPMQSAQCVVAAFELSYAMRRLGFASPSKDVLQLL